MAITAQYIASNTSFVFGTIISFSLLLKYKIHSFDKGVVNYFFTFWIILFSFEYFIFGSSSFIFGNDEGDLTFPYLNYMANGFEGGSFSHAIGSGFDAVSSYLTGGQFVSIELILLRVFPTWIAILVHILLMVSTGLVGTYLICRRLAGADRFTSATIATFFTVSSEFLVIHTYDNGSGMALIPLGIYLCVGRIGRNNYYPSVFLFAILFAVTANPIETIQPLFAGMLATTIFFRRRMRFFIISSVIILVITIINWADVFIGQILIGPLTARAQRPIAPPTFSWVSSQFSWLIRGDFTLLIPLYASLIIMAISRDKCFYRVVILLVVPTVLAISQSLVPWEFFGISLFNNAPNYYAKANTPLMIVVLATALTISRQTMNVGRWRVSHPMSVLMLSLVVGLLGWYKVQNFSWLLYKGGQSHFHTITNLKNKDWMVNQPVRIINLRLFGYGPETNVLFGFYGLHSFDAWVQLVPKRHSDFWYLGVFKPSYATGIRAGFDWNLWDWDRGGYRIEKQLNLDMLRIANVGYVISPLPLFSENVRLVSGPEETPITFIPDFETKKKFYKDRWKQIYKKEKVYVYELKSSLPRVFAANFVKEVVASMPPAEFLTHVREAGVQGGIVVRQSHAREVKFPAGGMTVEEFSLIRDGIDVKVTAPVGGILVANYVAGPFWRATIDGKVAEIFSANQVQFGVVVPAGSSKVEFRYVRPHFGD